MARYKGNKFRDGIPAITGEGKGDVIAVTSYYAHPSASTKLTDGDVIDLVKIPSGHELVGLSVIAGDLDSGTALTFSVGLLADTSDLVLDTVFVTDSTLGQAGGVLAIPAATTMFTTAAAATDKVLGIEVTATATGAGTDGAIIGVTAFYAPV